MACPIMGRGNLAAVLRFCQRHEVLVYRLHPNTEPLEHKPELTIIFFPGYSSDLSAWKNTWIQRGDPEVCWPRDWLPNAEKEWELERGISVLSVSYHTYDQDFSHDGVREIAKQLVQSLLFRDRWNLTHPHPILLVGHSMGGLVIKRLLVQVANFVHWNYALKPEMKDHCKAFLQNLQGIMFLAVPHFEASSDFEKHVILRDHFEEARFFLKPSGQSWVKKPRSRLLKELHDDFKTSIKEGTIIYNAEEGLPISRGGTVLVPSSSVQRLACTHHYKVEDANHFEICQPVSQQDISYVLLLQVIKVLLDSAKMVFSKMGIATPAIPSASVTTDCVAFQYQVLCDATISEIGRGSFGTVSKARITHNGVEREVAIKRLSHAGVSRELNDKFREEILRVSTARHKNIVSVLEYSVSEENSPLLMVTPLHSSLFKCLYKGEDLWLNWQARLKIAVGVAEGLAYLHEGTQTCLVHCDIKPGNILFDADTFQAYIVEFGTAKLMPGSESIVDTSSLRGTRGIS